MLISHTIIIIIIIIITITIIIIIIIIIITTTITIITIVIIIIYITRNSSNKTLVLKYIEIKNNVLLWVNRKFVWVQHIISAIFSTLYI